MQDHLNNRAKKVCVNIETKDQLSFNVTSLEKYLWNSKAQPVVVFNKEHETINVSIDHLSYKMIFFVA